MSASGQEVTAGHLLEKYVAISTKYVENTAKVSNMKLYTLNKMNETAHAHLAKNRDKVVLIEQELRAVGKQYDTIKECFKQVDDISSTIEGMESSADYLDVILSRIETKLTDLENMK